MPQDKGSSKASKVSKAPKALKAGVRKDAAVIDKATMPAYSLAQKRDIRSFTETTGQKESAAVKFLKSAGWNLPSALDAYFQVPSSPASGRPSNAASLNKIFDSFRDDPTQPDKIGAEGTMRYLQSLAVALDEPVLLAVLAQVSAPALSEMSRDAFVTGWEQRGADTSTKQRAEVARFRSQLRTDPTLFRTVYRHAFVLGKGGEGVGARAVPLDTAVEFWRLLFDPTKGWHWKSADGTEWLEPWLAFLTEKWKKSVGRDLWDQTLAFARKTVEDGSLGWWSEEAAWPSVVDEFVEHVKAERKAGRLPGTADPNSMEVE